MIELQQDERLEALQSPGATVKNIKLEAFNVDLDQIEAFELHDCDKSVQRYTLHLYRGKYTRVFCPRDDLKIAAREFWQVAKKHRSTAFTNGKMKRLDVGHVVTLDAGDKVCKRGRNRLEPVDSSFRHAQ